MKKFLTKLTYKKSLLVIYFLITIISGTALFFTGSFIYENAWRSIDLSSELMTMQIMSSGDKINTVAFNQVEQKIAEKNALSDLPETFESPFH